MKGWRWISGFLFGVLLGVIGAGQGVKVWRWDEPAAFVNGEAITKGELLERLLADFGEDTLRQLITLKLLEQQARREGIVIKGEEIRKRFREVKERQRELERKLERETGGLRRRLSDMTLWDESKKLVILEKLIGRRLKPKEEELKEFYRRHFIRYNRPEFVKIREIVVFRRVEAEQIYRRLLQTRPPELPKVFDRIARERSATPGMLGTFTYGELPLEMRAPIRMARPNEILPPIRVDIGGQKTFRIVWVKEKVPAKWNPFEKIRDIVRQDYILEQVALRSSDYVKALWERAKIQILVPVELKRGEGKKVTKKALKGEGR